MIRWLLALALSGILVAPALGQTGQPSTIWVLWVYTHDPAPVGKVRWYWEPKDTYPDKQACEWASIAYTVVGKTICLPAGTNPN